MKSYKEIEDYLHAKDLYPEDISQPLYKEKFVSTAVYDITIEGDWKHTHRYLTYLMKELGYVELWEKDITPLSDRGDDWGKSIHRYADKNFVEIFKEK